MYGATSSSGVLKFLKAIDQATPQKLDIHCIADNYATHKHPRIKAWLVRHPRFHLHFIPTSSSWLNLVERWFGKITAERIRRGVFKSVAELTPPSTTTLRTTTSIPSPLSGQSPPMTSSSRSIADAQPWAGFHCNATASCKPLRETLH